MEVGFDNKSITTSNQGPIIELQEVIFMQSQPRSVMIPHMSVDDPLRQRHVPISHNGINFNSSNYLDTKDYVCVC